MRRTPLGMTAKNMLRLLITYRYAVLAGFVSIAALFVMQRFPIYWVFLAAIGIWSAAVILLFRLIEKKINRRYPYLPLLFATVAGFVGLTSLIEWTPLRFFLNLLSGAVMMILFILPLHEASTARHEQKPWRRILMMLWVFDAYALATTFFAVGLLFQNIPAPILSVAAGAIFGASSREIWRLYFIEAETRLTLPPFLIGLIMTELVWTARLLPFGHLALGLLVTWAWYVLQLLIRFHMSPQGIVWRRQRLFLATNAILYVVFLFFVVRWI